MNLKEIRFKKETERILLSVTKNCETLIKQTHRKAEEILAFNLPNQEKRFISIHLYRSKDLGC